MSRIIKRLGLLTMLSLSGIFAYASFLINRSDQSGGSIGFFGPNLVEGASCAVPIGHANGTGTATGSGTATASGTGTATGTAGVDGGVSD
jgi:hypothetical protein